MTVRTWRAIAAGIAAATAALGSTTTTWDMNTYADFLRGRMSGLALSRDGKLSLAPKLETLLTSDQPEVWTLARGSNGTVYAGTGHRGRVYQIDQQGRATVLWTADQPEVFALATDSKGAVYAGTSPDGKVYRIENGKAAPFFDPKARYIWALAFGPDGALYVGTGDQGKIFRVDSSGAGSVYYESGQAHITALGFDREGRLLAGSEPNGILYRVTAPGKAFVLYDANLPEIRGITTMPDGTVYVAALGGSVAKRTAAASSSTTSGSTPIVTAPAMSITVTDSANAQAEFKQPKPEAPKAAQTQTAVSSTVTTPSAATVEIAGVEKSAIYKINPDNTVEQVWSSKEENAYDLAAFGSEIMFVTDVQGRLYRLNADRKPTLVAQTGEAEATRVFDTGAGLMIATGNLGKVYRLVAQRNTDGWFESPVHDANTVARWGRLSWRGVTPAGTRVVFRTRAGNSLRPDNTWSDWSAPMSDPSTAAIKSPNARYLQWRVELTSSNGQSPAVDSVTAAYLPQNTPPSVRSITVSVQPATGKVTATTTAAATAGAYSITVTDTGDTSASTSAGTPVQTVSRGPTSQIQLIWQADDPDGDKLTYSLYFRGDDEAEWKLIRANLTENTFLLDTDVLADGRYMFRVVASDKASNPLGTAREAELTSSPVLIDNTPPAVSILSSQRTGQGLSVEIEAKDATSSLRRCEYSLDAGPWVPLEAVDGVTDSPTERFALHLDKVAPGERVVVFRVFDAANNAGLAKAVVR